jgi:hypothetical protein
MKKIITVLSILLLNAIFSPSANALTACVGKCKCFCVTLSVTIEIKKVMSNSSVPDLNEIFNNERTNGFLDDQDRLIVKPWVQMGQHLNEIVLEKNASISICGKPAGFALKAGTYKVQNDGSFIIPISVR